MDQHINLISIFPFHLSILIKPGWLNKLRFPAFNAHSTLSVLYLIVFSFQSLSISAIYFSSIEHKTIALSVFSPVNKSQDFLLQNWGTVVSSEPWTAWFVILGTSKSKSDIHWMIDLSMLEKASRPFPSTWFDKHKHHVELDWPCYHNI